MPLTRRRKTHRKETTLLQSRMRLIIIAVLGVLAFVLLVLALRPAAQLINSPEIQRLRRLGVLRVGIRMDVPGFSQNGEGLEIMLARELSKLIFPENDPDIMLEFTTVNAYTALDKLKSGEIDITFSLQKKISSADYACSDPYYTDDVCILVRSGDENRSLKNGYIGMIEAPTALTALGQNSAAQDALAQYNENVDANVKAHANYASYPELIEALGLPTYDQDGTFLGYKEDFIAIPGAFVSNYLGSGIVLHNERLGTAAYTAVTAGESVSLSMLASIVIERMENNGQMASWIQQFGL